MLGKKLALVVAAGALPVAALAADSNVTVYGLIDYGYASRSGNENGGSKLQTKGRNGSLGEFSGGISAGNRIGFKGAEDLGNGLKAVFEIEFGFLGDDTAGVTFNKNRHSWVGLAGAFGTLLGGRVDGARYSFTGKYDPFKNQTVANAASVFGYTSGLGQGDRADNAILYISPAYRGLTFLAGYTKSLLTQEGTGLAKLAIPAPGAGQDIKQGDTPLYVVAAMYDNGLISATLDYEHLSLKKGSALPEDGEWNVYVTGGSYDFGVAKLSAYYEHIKGKKLVQGSKSNGWMLGVSAPVTPALTVMANYVDAKDKSNGVTNNDCKKFGIGGEYALSKRTALYTTYARIDAEDNANCAITLSGSTSADGATTTSSATQGVATNKAYGKSGFDIGMRHSF